MAKRGSTRWIVGGVIIAGAIISISFINLGENLVYFYTPAEAHAKASELEGQNIKIGAMVKSGTVDWTPEDLSLNFVMSDMKGHEIKVRHTGTPPDMFKEGQGVVVEGRLTNGGETIISRHLMVKHSEEYKKPDDHGSMNKAMLEKSMFKNESPKASTEAQ